MPRTSSKPTHQIQQRRDVPALTSQKPSFLHTLKDGIAFGVGSSIGHRIVGAIMSPSQNQTNKQEEYEQCMKKHDDRSVCQELLRS